MDLTWLDNNTWLWEINGKRILVDPWLVGKLVFLNSPWFFSGENPRPLPIPEHIDLILLSQGLPDHTHPETLSQIDRQTPVVCSPNAASVVKPLGYQHVTELPPGQVFVFDDAIKIQAVRGALMGPFLTENGYVLTDLQTEQTLYYEPHGFYDAALDELAPVDVAITPVVDLVIPMAGPIVQGQQASIEIVKRLKPQVMVPTTGGGDVQYQGLLAKVLQSKGSTDNLQQQLAQAQSTTELRVLRPGDRTHISVTPYRALAATPISE